MKHKQRPRGVNTSVDNTSAGKLYLVATPIGNLGDISSRALNILRTADVIACEDTRHSRRLMNSFEISTPLISYHEHNEAVRSVELIDRMLSGDSVAVVSDAGTPGISDPGLMIVREAAARQIDVVPIPGPVAFIAAVVASGFATDSIFFGGFLPSRAGERRRRLAEASQVPATLVFYESPRRLAKSLADCFAILGNRRAAIARELTKIHEQVVRGDLKSLAAEAGTTDLKGEIALVIARAEAKAKQPEANGSVRRRVRELEARGLDSKAALKQIARELGISKSEAYRRLEAEKSISKTK